uniref:Putative HNH endonuclease n=1 Tax=viral metagenome TaxID=1070528 RepID=A0A6H1ZV35_9ZZZZ
MTKELEPLEQWTIEYWIKARKYSKKYYRENYKKIKEYARQYYSKRYKTDLKFNLNSRMGSLMWYSLKKNKAGRTWKSLVSYNLNDLIKHLKKTMPEGYTWQDYLEGKLHLDHKIPISAFNFTKSEHTDFKRCWALSNLQLLPARENLVKSNKLTKPFQLALQI